MTGAPTTPAPNSPRTPSSELIDEIMRRYAVVRNASDVVTRVVPALTAAGLTDDDIRRIPTGVHAGVLDLLVAGFTRDQIEPIWTSGMALAHARTLAALGISHGKAVLAVQTDPFAGTGAEGLISAGVTAHEIEHLIDTNTDLSRASRIIGALPHQSSSTLTAPADRTALLLAARLMGVHPRIRAHAALAAAYGCPTGAEDTLVTLTRDGMDLDAALAATRALETPTRRISAHRNGHHGPVPGSR